MKGDRDIIIIIIIIICFLVLASSKFIDLELNLCIVVPIMLLSPGP
jgi:type IV secretory pathway VirB2 component (pilin)